MLLRGVHPLMRARPPQPSVQHGGVWCGPGWVLAWLVDELAGDVSCPVAWAAPSQQAADAGTGQATQRAHPSRRRPRARHPCVALDHPPRLPAPWAAPGSQLLLCAFLPAGGGRRLQAHGRPGAGMDDLSTPRNAGARRDHRAARGASPRSSAGAQPAAPSVAKSHSSFSVATNQRPPVISLPKFCLPTPLRSQRWRATSGASNEASAALCAPCPAVASAR